MRNLARLVLVAWSLMCLFYMGFVAFTNLAELGTSPSPQDPFIFGWTFGLIGLVMLTWLVVALPIFLFLSRDSRHPSP